MKAPQRGGFAVVRTRGSHHRLVHTADPTRATTIAVHPGRSLKKGTLRDIIDQAGFTVEEFVRLL